MGEHQAVRDEEVVHEADQDARLLVHRRVLEDLVPARGGKAAAAATGPASPLARTFLTSSLRTRWMTGRVGPNQLR